MSENKMQRGLKNRHLQMIALGTAVGTGLFYGSTATIAMAGPAVSLSYLIGGIIIFFIVRMLGEMSVEEPVSGSFSYYAAKYWGEFPGFLAGWNYWFLYILVSMAELSAVSIYLGYWFPDLPKWVGVLACLVIITVVNLVTVSAYGEIEFWMAFIKIAAIVGMILLGSYYIFSVPKPFPQNFENLWIHGGFFPNGVEGMLMSMAPVLFSFGGIELLGITAGEAENPDKTIPRAINQVIYRILIFYVGTMIVLMTLWPWNEVGKDASPFYQLDDDRLDAFALPQALRGGGYRAEVQIAVLSVRRLPVLGVPCSHTRDNGDDGRNISRSENNLRSPLKNSGGFFLTKNYSAVKLNKNIHCALRIAH